MESDEQVRVASDPASSAGEQLHQPSSGENTMDWDGSIPSVLTSADVTPRPLITSIDAKKRKRGISGPDARLAPNEESAITRAINSWETRRQDPIFLPYEGTRFNSFEEAKEFYNLYSCEIGFGIRISQGRKNDNAYITKKDLCCSCQSHCPNKQAASCRTGCRAMIKQTIL